MRRALFVTYGGGHVNMVVPVVRELQRRGGWEIKVLGLTTAARVLEEAGLPFIGFRHLVSPGDDAALKRGTGLAAMNHRDGMGIPMEESVAYLGLSYADLEERVGASEAERSFARIGRRAFLPLGPIERLIRREQPDVIVATNAPRAEEAAIRVAGKLGVPSLCMIDLFGLDWENAPFADAGFASKLAVLCDYTKQLYVNRGRPPEDIVVTGNPAFDRLADPDLRSRGAEWREARGWKEARVILWAPAIDPGTDVHDRTLRHLLSLLPSHPPWHLVYRPHPNEAPASVPPSSRACLSLRAEPLDVLLHAVDAVVVTTSTVGVEAALSGRPVIQVRGTPFDGSAPYCEMGIAVPSDGPEGLEQCLEAAFEKGIGEDVPRGVLHRNGSGSAAARVADLMDQVRLNG